MLSLEEAIEKYGPPPKLQPVEWVCGNAPVDVANHVKVALAKNFPEIADLFGGLQKCPAAIIGGSPSLNIDEVKEFRKKGHIFSCGSVHDHLLKNGVVPDFSVFMDSYPEMADLVNTSHDKINYLVCSACAPELFAKLEGKRIFLYHCWSDHPEIDEQYQGRFAVPSGGSCTVRTYFLALALGYRDLHFYGFDCSFPEDCKSQHAYDVPEAQISETVSITVYETGNRFITNTGFIVQANDFIETYKRLAKHEVTIHGAGLVADMFKVARCQAGT